jgi:hypothetical protein
MSKNITKTTEAATTNPIIAAAPAPVHTKKYANITDLLEELDRRSQLAGLKSLAGAVQFTMINTADWIVRQQMKGIASESPTLDERNIADEWTRGQDAVDLMSAEFGNEPQQKPEDKLKQYSHIYYGLVDKIRTLNPAPYERPRSLIDTLAEFTPRGVGLSEEAMKLLEAAESEPGEFLKAREENKARKEADMKERKPQIVQILNLNADCMPLIDTIEELPKHVQLRLATAAWKGVYFSRKQLVTYIATYNKLDDVAAVVAMAEDLKKIEEYCNNFELEHSQLFDMLEEAGLKVYGIADAKVDVKKPRS